MTSSKEVIGQPKNIVNSDKEYNNKVYETYAPIATPELERSYKFDPLRRHRDIDYLSSSPRPVFAYWWDYI